MPDEEKHTGSGIGDIPMPPGFRYRDILLRGKPCHDPTDSFRLRHPSMDPAKRAKIFAPFDALKGFQEAVSSKDVLYEEKRELNKEDRDRLNRQLILLRQLTSGARSGRTPVRISVLYYVPCRDLNSDSFGIRGQHRTITGICRKVDFDLTHSLFVGDAQIPLDDICSITGSDPHLQSDADLPPMQEFLA